MKSCTFWKKKNAGRITKSSSAASASSSPESTSPIELSGDRRSVLIALSSSVRNSPSPPALTARASSSRSQERRRFSIAKASEKLKSAFAHFSLTGDTQGLNFHHLQRVEALPQIGMRFGDVFRKKIDVGQ